MKKIYILIILCLIFNSCNMKLTQSRVGKISELLSKPDQVAITDGSDIFLIPKDTILPNVKFIFFNECPTVHVSDSSSWKQDYFTVYSITESYGRYGGTTYYIRATNGEISTELHLSQNAGGNWIPPTLSDRALIFYKNNAVTNTYKVIK